MKLPRDISGREFAEALGKLGYEVSHQTGSHIRLTTQSPSEHHVTVPDHPSLKVGTLNQLLRTVAAHAGVDRPTILRNLFDK
ncbi:MAG: hypothetical protein AMXMBFR47_26520 [Planctomycetota bacterium]